MLQERDEQITVCMWGVLGKGSVRLTGHEICWCGPESKWNTTGQQIFTHVPYEKKY